MISDLDIFQSLWSLEASARDLVNIQIEPKFNLLKIGAKIRSSSPQKKKKR